MVRKVGFGDDETETDTGLVRRGEPPKKPGNRREAIKETDTPTPTPAPSSNVSGKPRWVAIFFLLVFLSTWLGLSGFVIAGVIQHAGDGIPWSQMLWIVLSLYGTIILLRKLRHMYRGGSWLQTPSDAARKSGGDTA